MFASTALNLASTGSTETSPVFYVVLAVGLAIAFAIIRLIGNRRNAKRTNEALASVGTAAGDASAASAAAGPAPITFTTSPARPMPEVINALRSMFGETGAEPRITRYTRATVITTAEGITVHDKKAGALVSIPAAAVASISAAKVKLSPQGALPITIPALTVVVRHEGAEQSLVLAPITGLHDAVPLPFAQQLAEQMRVQLGVAS